MKPSDCAKSKGFVKGTCVSSPKHGKGVVVGYNGGTKENPILKVDFEGTSAFLHTKSLQILENEIKTKTTSTNNESKEEKDILGATTERNTQSPAEHPIEKDLIGLFKPLEIDLEDKKKFSEKKSPSATMSPINHFQGKKKRKLTKKKSKLLSATTTTNSGDDPLLPIIHKDAVTDTCISDNENEPMLREIQLHTKTLPNEHGNSNTTLFVILSIIIVAVIAIYISF